MKLEDDVETAASALRSALARRRRGGWPEGDDSNPLRPFRTLISRETFARLGELPDGLPDGDALRRWLACLVVERVTWDDRAAAEKARRSAEHTIADLGEERWSLRGLALELVRAQHEGRRARAAEGLARSAGAASDEAIWWLRRRHAAAHELGLESLPWLEAPFRDGIHERAAHLLFEHTDALAAEMLDRAPSWQDALHVGAAMDAREGWPSQLTPRWFRTVFGGWKPLQGARLEPGPLPKPVCGASFTRALFRFGTAVHRACAMRTASPFSMAQRPFDASEASYGALFGGLLASEPFLRRRLGLGKLDARRQARTMATSIVLAVRLDAVRSVFACQLDADQAVEAHARWASKALGSPMPDELAGVIPRYDPRAPARLAGALHAARMQRELVESYDEDWFDNPRAHELVTALDVTERLMIDEQRVVEGAREMGTGRA